MKRLLLTLLLSGCAAPAPPRPGDEAAPPGGEDPSLPYSTTVDLTLKDADLADVCERIGLQVGRNILVDPDVRATVSVRFQGVPWSEAIATLARQTGCEEEPRCSIVLLSRPPITVDFTQVSVRTLMHLVATYAGIRLELPPFLDAPVTIARSGRPRHLLQEILDAADLPYVVLPGHPIRLRRRPPVPLERRLIELRR